VYETHILQKRKNIENFSKYLNLDRKKAKVKSVKKDDLRGKISQR